MTLLSMFLLGVITAPLIASLIELISLILEDFKIFPMHLIKNHNELNLNEDVRQEIEGFIKND